MSVETRQVPEDAAAEAAAPAAAAATPNGITKVYSSGYNDQIWQFNFDAATGQITLGKKMQVRLWKDFHGVLASLMKFTRFQ